MFSKSTPLFLTVCFLMSPTLVAESTLKNPLEQAIAISDTEIVTLLIRKLEPLDNKQKEHFLNLAQNIITLRSIAIKHNKLLEQDWLLWQEYAIHYPSKSIRSLIAMELLVLAVCGLTFNIVSYLERPATIGDFLNWPPAPAYLFIDNLPYLAMSCVTFRLLAQYNHRHKLAFFLKKLADALSVKDIVSTAQSN